MPNEHLTPTEAALLDEFADDLAKELETILRNVDLTDNRDAVGPVEDMQDALTKVRGWYGKEA